MVTVWASMEKEEEEENMERKEEKEGNMERK